MTSGRRAKAERAREAQLRREVRDEVEARHSDPLSRQSISRNGQHPLGNYAGAHEQWKERMKVQLLRIMAENREALKQCTGQHGCPSSVHHPGCAVVP